MTAMLMSSFTLFLLALPTLSTAFTWKFDSAAEQCQNLSISIVGSDGKPPYRVLILPSGPTPLANNIEARRIVDQPFPGNSTSVSFQLKYPVSSQFVAVVSDATGFGSGGTSGALPVLGSSDASCFDATTNVQPAFFFFIQPQNQIVQCVPTRLWWDKTKVQGTPNFLGLIPGGQSFAIPPSKITDVENQGTGFSWTPNVRGGSTLIIVAGDSRGNGTAGSTLNTVANGPDNISSCLDDTSPSSTPGSPAGGSYPTGSTGGSSGTTGGGTNIGAIVGGVVGGVVAILAIILLLIFFRRRDRLHRKQNQHKERPLNLLNVDDGDDAPDGVGHRNSRNDLPEYYQPEPFTVPDPTISSDFDGETSDGRPLSGYTTTTSNGTQDVLSTFGGGSTTTGGRKGPLRQMRPVNIIQHDDAGPSIPSQDTADVETVELPPAYTNIRR